MQTNMTMTPATPRFTSAYASTLETLRPIEREVYNKAVGELLNTKLWDMVVDEFGPRVQSKINPDRAYRGFTTEGKPMLGELYLRVLRQRDINNKQPESLFTKTLTMLFDNQKDAMETYHQINKLNNEGNEVGVAVLVTKLLEKMGVK